MGMTQKHFHTIVSYVPLLRTSNTNKGTDLCFTSIIGYSAAGLSWLKHFKFSATVEPPKTDFPYYGNLQNADKSPRSRIIPYTIVYVYIRKPPYKGHLRNKYTFTRSRGVLISEVPLYSVGGFDLLN